MWGGGSSPGVRAESKGRRVVVRSKHHHTRAHFCLALRGVSRTLKWRRLVPHGLPRAGTALPQGISEVFGCALAGVAEGLRPLVGWNGAPKEELQHTNGVRVKVIELGLKFHVPKEDSISISMTGHYTHPV